MFPPPWTARYGEERGSNLLASAREIQVSDEKNCCVANDVGDLLCTAMGSYKIYSCVRVVVLRVRINVELSITKNAIVRQDF